MAILNSMLPVLILEYRCSKKFFISFFCKILTLAISLFVSRAFFHHTSTCCVTPPAMMYQVCLVCELSQMSTIHGPTHFS